MRVAELLEDLPDDVRPGVELLAVNGEDHHQAAGEIDYLAHTDLAYAARQFWERDPDAAVARTATV